MLHFRWNFPSSIEYRDVNKIYRFLTTVDYLCLLGSTEKLPPEEGTESSLKNVVFWIKDMMMDNFQNCDSYIDIPSSQTYR
jgi:hypothetical protein